MASERRMEIRAEAMAAFEVESVHRSPDVLEPSSQSAGMWLAERRDMASKKIPWIHASFYKCQR